MGRNGEATQIKPGQVLNPKGHNQYTARGKAEVAFDALLTKHIRGGKPGTPLTRILAVVVELAESGNTFGLDQVLKRILPVVERHALVDTGELDTDSLGDRLAALVTARTTNGSGRPAEPKGANGSGGGGS